MTSFPHHASTLEATEPPPVPASAEVPPAYVASTRSIPPPVPASAEVPPAYVAPTRPIPPPPNPEPGTVAHEEHAIDPPNELAIGHRALLGHLSVIVTEMERQGEHLAAVRERRQADHKRIADLEEQLAREAADFHERRANLLTTCKGKDDRIAYLEGQLRGFLPAEDAAAVIDA